MKYMSCFSVYEYDRRRVNAWATSLTNLDLSSLIPEKFNLPQLHMRICEEEWSDESKRLHPCLLNNVSME